ncbi:MAG: HI0074 family nucleotidyltransferase substrate-binding subunit [Alphaproteobacteria bacterium]|jgi:nucleotidyltransferase substrate binding protein (TIGR01987 family)|nr:HI0074 family nucleotidyltransferase substrate-binding subunit [Candidatus Jidaibacter sp.]
MLKSEIKLEKLKKALNSLEMIYLKPVQEDRANIDATIQRFEFTFELAWKFLKDYFAERDIELNYPKDVIQEAFQVHLISNEALWISMLKDRNLTSHTYEEKLADAIYERIKIYVPALQDLLKNITVA